jgi:hypothetical protein
VRGDRRPRRRSAPRGRGGESTTRRRQRTKARRVEALDLAGLDVGPLRVGGESFDDAVQLAGLAQLRSDISPRRNSVRRVFFPSTRTASTSARYSFAVSPRCLTVRFTNTYRTSYGVVSSQLVDCFAPTSECRYPIRRTVRAGQELVAVRQAASRAKLRSGVGYARVACGGVTFETEGDVNGLRSQS